MMRLALLAALLQAPNGCLSLPLPAGLAQVYLAAPGGSYDGFAYVVRLVDGPDAHHAFVRDVLPDDCGPGGWGAIVAVAELRNGQIWIPAGPVAGVTGWVAETYDAVGRLLTASRLQRFGPAGPCPSAFGWGDLDGDGAIGLADFARLQNSWTGP